MTRLRADDDRRCRCVRRRADAGLSAVATQKSRCGSRSSRCSIPWPTARSRSGSAACTARIVRLARMSDVTGVLLAQLGTPASPAVPDVRRYLREFLSDPRVIDLPAPARWLLVNAIIAPFRAPKSAHAYRAIWTPEGSPLLVHSRALAAALQRALGAELPRRARHALRRTEPRARPRRAAATRGVARIVAFPLYPQVRGIFDRHGDRSHPRGRSAAQRAARRVCVRRAVLRRRRLRGRSRRRGAPDPRAHERSTTCCSATTACPSATCARADPSRGHCLASASCCDAPPPAVLGGCYRAQCFATTRALAAALALPSERVTTSFQSRLGRDAVDQARTPTRSCRASPRAA